MKIFNLPDLGEGLPDAEIHEWHVKVGDSINADDPMLSVETAKAVVDVPAPFSGVVSKLYGQPGDIIKTGNPLIAFEGEGSNAPATDSKAGDAGTVVGNIPVNDNILQESATGLQPKTANGAHSATVAAATATTTTTASTQTSTASVQAPSHSLRIIPEIRALARRLHLDLNQLTTASGPNQLVTTADVLAAAAAQQAKHPEQTLLADATPLRGVRRAMAISMSQSHQSIVPVTIVDDADLHRWPKGTDITARLIRALVKAAAIEPAMNALYDGANMAVKRMSAVHVGIAMDSADGLFVPVLKHAEKASTDTIRQTIETFKQQVTDRNIPSEHLQGATISLSNFGTFAGRYANPIVVPPAIAILGAGRFRNQLVLATEDGAQPENHRILPLSLSFDHRAATGGEASRFLAAVIADLQLAE